MVRRASSTEQARCGIGISPSTWFFAFGGCRILIYTFEQRLPSPLRTPRRHQPRSGAPDRAPRHRRPDRARGGRSARAPTRKAFSRRRRASGPRRCLGGRGVGRHRPSSRRHCSRGTLEGHVEWVFFGRRQRRLSPDCSATTSSESSHEGSLFRGARGKKRIERSSSTPTHSSDPCS